MKAVVSEKAKVVILTGASSGIGEATARHLSRLGHHLFIGARRLERLTALEAELRAKGGNIDAMALDVTRPEDLQRIVASGAGNRLCHRTTLWRGYQRTYSPSYGQSSLTVNVFSSIRSVHVRTKRFFHVHVFCWPCCYRHRCRQRYRPGDRRTVASPGSTHRRGWPGR
ncbi:SDR family NAD(P)-dependent oxidoreductase [Prodigiosinella aquatilis]|nr:SDR family NAD(P)-dependent oxidoreductase [Prodigiosinella sp. LS101]WJV53869.1 SDR family NAD(P)-dependent oxidoreductase [Prodigiosinella sp. LS101]WJV58231.1 SDR family NAD(P)-dependent oxidoreductase [Pectobacteriaceae bacterium C111]